MKKKVITGAIAIGIISSIIVASTVGDNKKVDTTKEKISYMNLNEVEIEYGAKSKKVTYPLTSAISDNDNKDLIDEILSYTDGKNDDGDISEYTVSYTKPVVESKKEIKSDEVIAINDEYNDADREIISYFNDAKKEMQDYLKSDDYINLKNKAKSIVVTGIDFLFYDGTIKGFTREELSEKGKEDVIISVDETFNFLDQYYPGFSDSFDSKYTKVKEFLSSKYASALDKVKEWIGTDEYNALGEDFKDIGNTIIDVLDGHYQSWKKK